MSDDRVQGAVRIVHRDGITSLSPGILDDPDGERAVCFHLGGYSLAATGADVRAPRLQGVQVAFGTGEETRQGVWRVRVTLARD